MELCSQEIKPRALALAALMVSSVAFAVAPRAVAEQPAGLDEAGRVSLRQTVAMSVGQQSQLLAADGAEGAEYSYSVTWSGDIALSGYASRRHNDEKLMVCGVESAALLLIWPEYI